MSLPTCFLLPLCVPTPTRVMSSHLENFGSHQIFDRNILGVIAQLAVRFRA